MSAKSFLIVLAVIYLSLLSVHAISAPKASSGEECFYAADIALTSRAMVLEDIPKLKIAAILARMYVHPVAPMWAVVLINAAMKDKRDAQAFASEFYAHCTKNSGNTDGFFGLDT